MLVLCYLSTPLMLCYLSLFTPMTVYLLLLIVLFTTATGTGKSIWYSAHNCTCTCTYVCVESDESIMQVLYSLEIAISPESAVVFIDSAVEFTCGINLPFFTWNVNGSFFVELNESLRADLKTVQQTVGNNEMYTLTIPTRAMYNGTVVQCVAGTVEGVSAESQNATLLIQGNWG